MEEASMHLLHRIYQGERDRDRMAALVRVRSTDNLHVVDLPYRLSSWAFDAPENCALWEDRSGDMLAWAVLQSPFWAIDYAIHPAAPATMHQDVLAWADQRARAVQGTPFGRPM